MILSEILEQVDVLVPNSLPPHIKVGFLNQVQNQLYRDYPFSDVATNFNVLPGESFYPLPEDFVEDRSVNLVVNDRELPFVPLFSPVGYEDTQPYWSIVQGSLFINPVPMKAGTAYLYYGKSPKQLDLTDIEAETIPDLHPDFHELYVLGCCARVARASPETIPLVSMYESEFLRLAEKADLKLTKKRQQTVMTVRCWQ